MQSRRFLACVLTPALAMTLAAAVPSVSAAAPEKTKTWSGQMLAYATESLADREGLSIAAIPLNGPGIEQYINADKPMNPGSIMKLITTYAALEILGPTFQWDTRFYTDGTLNGSTVEGNLYVKFGGDPKLTVERLWSVIRELRGMGLDTITGDLVLDGNYFQLPEGLPLFEDNGNNPYAPFLVEPSGYLTNLNLQHFEVRADERGTQAWSTPALEQVVIDNRVIATEAGQCPARRNFTWKPIFHDDGRVTVRVEGRLAQGCRTAAYFSLLSHKDYSAATISSVWKELGGTLKGDYRFDSTPDDARLMMVTSSPDLVTMVRDINKWSSNVMARQLLLTMGAENRLSDEEDDRVAGIRVVYEWLEAKGINTAGMVLDNGAGLSRYERITTRQTARILQHAWNSPFAADLQSSMPLIAMDGTMVRRLRNTALKGEGRIKTGYLEDVRSIAGFTRDESETSWVIVGIVNHSPAWNGQALLDRVLYSLYYNPPMGTSLSQGPATGSTVQ